MKGRPSEGRFRGQEHGSISVSASLVPDNEKEAASCLAASVVVAVRRPVPNSFPRHRAIGAYRVLHNRPGT
jgi:hypothetical protein